MKFEFSGQIFEKKLQMSKLIKSVQWESSCSMRTDRHDEANSRFSKFCESTEKLVKCIVKE